MQTHLGYPNAVPLCSAFLFVYAIRLALVGGWAEGGGHGNVHEAEVYA
jgi:hypothetical protein